jgi:hypothetical protein
VECRFFVPTIVLLYWLSITKITPKQRFSFQFFGVEKIGKLFQILEKLFGLTIEQKTKTPKKLPIFWGKNPTKLLPNKNHCSKCCLD